MRLTSVQEPGAFQIDYLGEGTEYHLVRIRVHHCLRKPGSDTRSP